MKHFLKESAAFMAATIGLVFVYALILIFH